MKRLCQIFIFGMLAAPLVCAAKRIPPREVAPVVVDGVTFTAPFDDAKFGYVEACDAATKKKLWRAVIFRIQFDPDLEQDVQWVGISGLALDKRGLVVTAEDGSVFCLDLKTKEVMRIKDGSAKLLPPLTRK